jgi:hypothetical protein
MSKIRRWIDRKNDEAALEQDRRGPITVTLADGTTVPLPYRPRIGR